MLGLCVLVCAVSFILCASLDLLSVALKSFRIFISWIRKNSRNFKKLVSILSFDLYFNPHLPFLGSAEPYLYCSLNRTFHRKSPPQKAIWNYWSSWSSENIIRGHRSLHSVTLACSAMQPIGFEFNSSQVDIESPTWS